LQEVLLIYLNTTNNNCSYIAVYYYSKKLLSILSKEFHSIFLINYIKLVIQWKLNRDKECMSNQLTIKCYLKRILNNYHNSDKLINFTLEYIELIKYRRQSVSIELSDYTYKFSMPQGGSNEDI
jgi:hypothetical protein